MIYGMALANSFVNVKMLLVKIPGEFFNLKCIVGHQFSFLENLLIHRILHNSIKIIKQFLNVNLLVSTQNRTTETVLW